MVKTSEALNSLDSLNKELSQKCPWLTESTVGENNDGVKKCLMALNCYLQFLYRYICYAE